MTREKLRGSISVYMQRIERLFDLSSQDYAREEDALENFSTQSAETGNRIDRRQVLMVFLNKHLYAIRNHVWRGGGDARESIQGRIKDAIVFLFILWAMIDEGEENVDKLSS